MAELSVLMRSLYAWWTTVAVEGGEAVMAVYILYVLNESSQQKSSKETRMCDLLINWHRLIDVSRGVERGRHVCQPGLGVSK